MSTFNKIPKKHTIFVYVYEQKRRNTNMYESTDKSDNYGVSKII